MILARYNNQTALTKEFEHSVILLGNFDCIHLGHIKLIRFAKQIACENNKKLIMMNFYPHPIEFFKKLKKKHYRILNIHQKTKILSSLGVDMLLFRKFNNNFANLSATDFVDKILLDELKASHLVTGYNFTFGKNRLGNINYLIEQAKSGKFAFSYLDIIGDDKSSYSSSNVRELIKNADLERVREIIGRDYQIQGIVTKGKGLARNLGYKTANIILSNVVSPKFGVYQASISIKGDDRELSGIVNIGIKPTVIDKNLAHQDPILEAHIFNFDDDLYNKKLSINLLKFIREEKKFDSVDELTKQIKADISLLKNDV